GTRKIAVLRANAIGDLMFSLPALQSLRAAYPAAEITHLGAPWHADFVPGRVRPVDRVVVVPPVRGVTLPDTAEGGTDTGPFLSEMRAEGFDLAIQLHGGGQNSNPLVAALGARTTIGLRAPDALALDRNVPFYYWQHEVLRCLE